MAKLFSFVNLGKLLSCFRSQFSPLPNGIFTSQVCSQEEFYVLNTACNSSAWHKEAWGWGGATGLRLGPCARRRGGSPQARNSRCAREKNRGAFAYFFHPSISTRQFLLPGEHWPLSVNSL